MLVQFCSSIYIGIVLLDPFVCFCPNTANSSSDGLIEAKVFQRRLLLFVQDGLLTANLTVDIAGGGMVRSRSSFTYSDSGDSMGGWGDDEGRGPHLGGNTSTVLKSPADIGRGAWDKRVDPGSGMRPHQERVADEGIGASGLADAKSLTRMSPIS